MNKLNRADINAARGLRHEQEFWIDVIFAPDDQFLLVPAGERACRKRGVRWTHVKALNDLVGAALNEAANRVAADVAAWIGG